MKISERSCPLLKYLKWDKPLIEHPDFKKAMKLSQSHPDYGIPFCGMYIADETRKETQDCIKNLWQHWDAYAELYRKQIDVISMPFYESMLKCASSLLKPELVEEMIGEDLVGTILMPQSKVAICYLISITGTRHINANITVFKDFDTVTFFCIDSLMGFQTNDKRFNPDNQTFDDAKAQLIQQILLYHLFKKYAKIETKIINKKSRIKHPDGEKDINETDFDLNYVDCTWFTNIFRSEGFKVRGHFRLQPKKNEAGEWTKELIYINEFQKHGYTRKAKMLLNQETPTE